MSTCVLEEDSCPMFRYDDVAKSCDFIEFDPTNPDPILTSPSDGYKVNADVDTPVPQTCKSLKAFVATTSTLCQNVQMLTLPFSEAALLALIWISVSNLTRLRLHRGILHGLHH